MAPCVRHYLVKMSAFLLQELSICAYKLTRVDENDKKNFDRIMKLHPRFPELIMAFKEDPDAYDNFVAMVSFLL